jgi:hypothetical protein
LTPSLWIWKRKLQRFSLTSQKKFHADLDEIRWGIELEILFNVFGDKMDHCERVIQSDDEYIE